MHDLAAAAEPGGVPAGPAFPTSGLRCLPTSDLRAAPQAHRTAFPQHREGRCDLEFRQVNGQDWWDAAGCLQPLRRRLAASPSSWRPSVCFVWASRSPAQPLRPSAGTRAADASSTDQPLMAAANAERQVTMCP